MSSSPAGERRYSTSDVAKPQKVVNLQIPSTIRSISPAAAVETSAIEYPLSSRHVQKNAAHVNTSVGRVSRKESFGSKPFRMSKAKQIFHETPPTLKLLHPNSVEFVEISAKELARQLTLISASNFRSINRKEFENLGWTGANKIVSAPCISKMTLLFNQIASWVAHRILSCEKIQQRLLVLSFFINTANVCLQLDNYDGVRAVMSGLQSASVHRLGRTWALLGRIEREMYAKLEELTTIENNSEKYRKKLSLSSPPLVPYLGINLSDLTYVYECIKKDKDNSERKAQYKERNSQFEQMLNEIAALQRACVYSYIPDVKLVTALEAEYSLSEEELIASPEKHYRISLALEEKNINAPAEEQHESIGSTVEKTFASLRGYKLTERITEFTAKLRNNGDDHSSVSSSEPQGDYILAHRPRPKLDGVFNNVEHEPPSLNSPPNHSISDISPLHTMFHPPSKERTQKHVSLEVNQSTPKVAMPQRPESQIGAGSKNHLLKLMNKSTSTVSKSGKGFFGSMSNIQDMTVTDTTSSKSDFPTDSNHISNATGSHGKLAQSSPARDANGKQTNSLTREASTVKENIKHRFSGGVVINTNVKSSKMEIHSAITEKPPSSILTGGLSETSIPEQPITQTRFHLEGELLKKEEFDEDGERVDKNLRTWVMYNVVLDGNQVTFTLQPPETTLPKTSSKKIESLPRNFREGFTKTGSLVNLKSTEEPLSVSAPASKEVTRSRDTDATVTPSPHEPSSVYPELTDEEKSRTLPTKGKGHMREILGKMLQNNHVQPQSRANRPLNRSLSQRHGDEIEEPAALGKRPDSRSRSRSLSRELIIEGDEKEKEIFRIDNFCTVNHVPEHRRKFVFRAMFSQQRSFLLRASTESEMNLWIHMLRMAIGKEFLLKS